MPFDIGIGLLLGVWLHGISHISFFSSLLIGVTACMLPDLDAILNTIKVGYVKSLTASDHREGLHYPLLYLPAIALICFINPYVGLIFVIGGLAHFLHDSIGIGWGVMWFYPISDKSYCFLYRVPLKAETNLPKQKIYVWNKTEKRKVISAYADPHFMRHVYLKPTLYAFIEYVVLVVGMATVVAIIR